MSMIDRQMPAFQINIKAIASSSEYLCRISTLSCHYLFTYIYIYFVPDVPQFAFFGSSCVMHIFQVQRDEMWMANTAASRWRPTKAKSFTKFFYPMNPPVLNKPHRRATELAKAIIMGVIWYSEGIKPPEKKSKMNLHVRCLLFHCEPISSTSAAAP